VISTQLLYLARKTKQTLDISRTVPFNIFYYICWTNIKSSDSCWLLFLGFKYSTK